MLLSNKAKPSEIIELLLTPLGELFGELTQKRLSTYIGALSGYNCDELRSCFIHLRDTYEPKSKDPYPPISVIHKARSAASAARSTSPASEGGKFIPFKEQHETRKKLVDAYLQQFEMDKLSEQARSAGYHGSLFAYVREVANVQAQMIVPTNGIGYSSAVLFAHINTADGHHAMSTAVAQFWDDCRKQVSAEGRIAVSIPLEAINHWREFNAAIRRNAMGVGYPHSQASRDALKNHVSQQISNTHINETMADVIMGAQQAVNHHEMQVEDVF